MKAEIIAVGTELLLGQIVNTNAQFLSEKCADMGIDVYFQTVVGDNASRLREAVKIARGRADLLIFTGGLGPTQDDLTKEVLAELLGRSLIIHQPSMDKMVSMFESRGIPMVESNVKQAQLIDGSTPLMNDTGLAVGDALIHEGTHYIVLPGPPKEMKPMFESYAKPWLRTVMTDTLPLFSKMLKFAGIGESNLEHALIDLVDGQQDPTIATYAKEGEVALRLTTRAPSEQDAQRKMAAAEAEVRSRVGGHIYADEDVPMEHVIVRLMSEQGLKLAVAESCTGGLFSDMITSVPGSSQVYLGGVVCYSNALKHRMLNVPIHMLEGDGTPGAVSSETAGIMAEQLLELTECDVSVSITGVAGPAASEGKPVGLVYIAIGRRGGETSVERIQLSGNRETIKLMAAKHALYRLWKLLK
jgi:nicotinamide-nucleotide amidase